MASSLLSGLEMLQANVNGETGILKCRTDKIILKKKPQQPVGVSLGVSNEVIEALRLGNLQHVFFPLLFNSTKFYHVFKGHNFISRLSVCQKSRKKHTLLPLRSYRVAGIFPTYYPAGRDRDNAHDLKFIGFNIITLESLPQRFSMNSG